MRYRADLDGLRAAAVLAVFASHAPLGEATRGGWVGGRWYLIPHIAWQTPLVAIVTAALILHLLADRPGISSLLVLPPLVALGRRSYGFYLYHLPVIFWLSRNTTLGAHGRLPFTLAALAVTLAITWASYRFVELPFLRLKKRFEPRAETPDTAPPVPA